MLKVEHIVKRYGAHLAVDDLSFTMEKGQILGFLGRNGAGKSTVMNVITGYIAPTASRVLCARKSGAAFKAALGYLPEVPLLYPDLTVREMREFMCGIKRIRRGARSRHVRGVSELARIEDCGKKQIKQLSKGYRQHVGLALALVGNPEILILDEPTAGLDPEQVAGMREMICAPRPHHPDLQPCPF